MNLGQSISQKSQGRVSDVTPETASQSFKAPPREQLRMPEPPQMNVPLDVDAMVIPTMSGGTGNQMSEYPEGQEPEMDMQAEQLTPELRKEAADVIDFFGEPLVQKLYSRTWQLREEAIADMEDITVKASDSEGVFTATVLAVSLIINDRNANVI